MDAGNREEEDRLGATLPARDLASPSPSTPRRPSRYHNHNPHHHHYPLAHVHTKPENGHKQETSYGPDHARALQHNYQQETTHFIDDPHGRHSRSTLTAGQLGPASLTISRGALDSSVFGSHVASNLDAAHVNAIASIEPNGFNNPDDFYRARIDDLMASTVSAPRQSQDTLRHNGNMPVPRHPAIRSNNSASMRSASAPLEERQNNGVTRSKHATTTVGSSHSGHQPSVKDLKKKFDQNVTHTSSATTRKAHTRAPARESQWPVANGHKSYPDVRSSASSNAARSPSASSPTLRSTHNHRTAPEDTTLDNAQSFASRIAKPRSSIGSQTQASKSMTHLPPSPSSAAAPPLPKQSMLLFGEIEPAELHAGLVGHGIDTVLERETLDPIEGRPGRRQRSFSYTDLEPSSPTDWYRNVRKGSENGGGADAKVLPLVLRHSRSRSDMGGVGLAQQSAAATSSRPKPTIDTSALVSPSRIPVSVRKLSAPSTSSSPNSTRSNSPSTVRRPFAPGKKSNPSSNTGVKITSPVVAPNMKRQHRPGAITPANNTRLNAYISTPPPKLSPPLRSSRPRQPVSAATTISSRTKAAEREKSPGKRDGRGNGKSNESFTRWRKLPMAPIDYESRREQIKVSYTKSIRENEARATARKAAQERKKKEEAEAKLLAAKARDAQLTAGVILDLREVVEETQEQEREEREKRETVESSQTQPIHETAPSTVDANAASTVEPRVVEPLTLRMITSSLAIESPVDSEPPVVVLQPTPTIETGSVNEEIPIAVGRDTVLGFKDSPTLGIPGSFPNASSISDHDEAPPSAISTTTEFDTESQTDPPIQESPVFDNITEIPIGIESDCRPTYRQSQYRSPFDDDAVTDDGLSIKIALDTSTGPIIIPELFTPTPDDNAGTSQVVPVAYREEAYGPMPLNSTPYETKVTILGPGSDFTSPVSEVEPPVCPPEAPEQHPDSGRGAEQGHEPPLASRLLDSNIGPVDIEQAEPSCGLSEIAEFFVGPLIKDQGSSHVVGIDQEVTRVESKPEVETEESDLGDDLAESLYPLDSRASETRPSLTIPRTSDSGNRASQTTMWTDFSVNSQDSSSGYGPTEGDSRDAGPTWREEFVAETKPDSYPYIRDTAIVSGSRDVSPCGTYRDSESSERQLSHHQLPEIDTGEAFTEEILSRKNSISSFVIPAIPTHAPPLPPDHVSFRDLSSAPPSEYYNETRPSSYLRNDKDDHSLVLTDSLRRDSDYFLPLESATRSIDQGSLTTSEGAQSTSDQLASQQTLVESINVDQASDLSAKEKKRLFTRLETVKELIDTEAFFIRDMNIVEEIYKGTAEACPKLDDQTIKLIFRNTDKIVEFHSEFLAALKEGVSSIYTPRTHRQAQKDVSSISDGATSSSGASITASGHLSDEKDRETSLGPIFIKHMDSMKQVHETFLKNSDHAAKRLIQIQEDPTVQVWLNECNEVARELTRAWNLDSLLIKPMQRITKYPNLLIQLLHETPSDHPDRPSLEAAKTTLENAIEEINKAKKNFELVGQIVSRRRKESDVRAGFARAFGKRVDKLQAATNKPAEDVEYQKLHEKFGDDYLRLQVVLRDVEFYTRQVTDHVHEFLQYLSSMELVMRLQPSPYPEIESKWVRFNVSMRDMQKVALEQHLSQVRKQVIEPFEMVIKSYSNPSLAMKKRSKRRVDYDKYVQLQKGGKKIDKQLTELVEQYEALNEALKKELPKLSALTEKVGNICLGNFVNIQAQWFSIWKEKIKVVLEDQDVPELSNIVSTFHRDYKLQDEQISTIGIVNPAAKGRPSQSTSVDEAAARFRLRPTEPSPRLRGLSLNSDVAPTLPAPDFMKRHSGQFAVSPSLSSLSSPNQFYRDYYTGVNGQARSSDSPKATDASATPRSMAATPARPSTGQSHESSGIVRQSLDSSLQSRENKSYSNSAQPSPYQLPEHHRFSGLFQSALPMSDAHERPPRPSHVSSRGSSRERQPINGYNVLWLAASLFEFNIQTTKHEAGYPYLTYQAGEIFDVIAEKGELWLAKNQDDPNNLVGWLWSKHFAKLADD
ncbi:hypothetical protein GGS20DRAFT_470891 [Poronia punctata]|nr:hypothetical protein GGS20DRAFT_470891 [Poronia punctata]